MSAAISLPAAFVRFRANRAIFAVADDGQLRFRDAHRDQKFLRRLRAFIAQSQIVFSRSALVGAAFDQQFLSLLVLQ